MQTYSVGALALEFNVDEKAVDGYAGLLRDNPEFVTASGDLTEAGAGALRVVFAVTWGIPELERIATEVADLEARLASVRERRDNLLRTLLRNGGNRVRLAAAAHVSRASLYRL